MKSLVNKTAILIFVTLLIPCSYAKSPDKSPASSTLHPAPEPTPSPSIAQPSHTIDSPEKSAQELAKLQMEIEKLKAEIDNLKINNEALSPLTRTASAWLGSLGGVLAAIAGGSLAWFFNSGQREKLKQEKEFEREKHLMELFKNLGAESLRVQLAAASVLVQRLDNLYNIKQPDNFEALEKKTIAQVLITITKKNKKDPPPNPALLKFIADNLASALGAFPTAIATGTAPESSPLKEFDFQSVQFPTAYWRRIDAREVDFFRADLSKCGLSGGNFQKAVLMEANLSESVLKEANLKNSDLRGADLSKAKVQKAEFDGAKVFGAKLTGIVAGDNPPGKVDNSPMGDGSRLIDVQAWLSTIASSA